MGFILKTTDTNYDKAVPLLKKGIETDAPGVIDGRFFFHLGDAQYRLGNATAVSHLHCIHISFIDAKLAGKNLFSNISLGLRENKP